MTAYEFAEIMTVHDESRIWEHGLEIANMLRQQADRIAELEKQSLTEKDLKNACRNARLSEDDFLRIKAYLPVYSTPQTKPLSDEEIVYLAKRFEGVWDGAVDYKRFARAIEAKVRGEK